jgi:zinc protease
MICARALWPACMVVVLAAAACEDTEPDTAAPASATPAPTPAPPDEPFRGMAPAPGVPIPFVSPAVDHFTLNNGVDVVLVERHALPTVYWQIQYPGGPLRDPPGKEGRAALCMWLLVQGGDRDTVERLGNMGSNISASWSTDTTSLSGFALTQHFGATSDLWAHTLARPGSSNEALAWVRQQIKGRLLQGRSDPNTIAYGLLLPLALGADHPHARQPTARSFDGITLSDCAQFNDTLVTPGARLFIAGDITRADVEQTFVDRLPHTRQALPAPVVPVPGPAIAAEAPRIVFANLPGATQTTILMWGPGPTRQAPDYDSATVMASIFAGNSLTSRLGQDLREMMGSTYSVSGGFAFWKTNGLLMVSAPVAADRTGSAIEAMVRDAAGMISGDVTADELHLARDGRITALPGRFASVLGTLGEFMDLVYYDLPLTYFDAYAAHLAAVDAASVRQAARDYLAAPGLRFIVVGDAKTSLAPLQALVTSGILTGGQLRVVEADENSAP